MDNEKIINRINNLLAKTVENGCTPEELKNHLMPGRYVNLRRV
jgi:uncharacterized protein YnzC (UPF0291/DUF896 family)